MYRRRGVGCRLLIGEGINFTVDDPTRLVYSLHKANLIATQVGIRQYKKKPEASGDMRKPNPGATKVSEVGWSHGHDSVQVMG